MDLRRWRQTNGVTQKELADAVGVTVSFLSHLERGVRAPSADTAKKIAAFTADEVTAASLLGLDTPPKRKPRGVREDGASFDNTEKPWRTPVSVTVQVELTAGQLEDYRKLLPDLKAIAAEGARAALRDAHQEAWNEANREAIKTHSKWIEERGTFHDQFGEW